MKLRDSAVGPEPSLFISPGLSLFISPGLSLFIVSALLGALLGRIYTGETDMLPNARFLAGLVQYPEGSPVPIAYAGAPTPLLEIFAALLRLGVSENLVGSTLVCMVAAVYAQALSMIAFGLCRRAAAAVAIGVFAVWTTAYMVGPDYPIFTLGRAQTQGILGFAVALHVLGLVGMGWIGAAGFVLGLAPAVHPVLGVFMIGAVGLSWPFWRHRLDPALVRRAAARFGVGLAISAVALAFIAGRVRGYALPEVDPVWLKAYLWLWDGHRNIAVSPRALLILAKTGITMGVLGLWLWLNRGKSDDTGVVMVGILVVASVLGIVLYAVFHFDRTLFPTIAVVAMPSRFINLPEAMTFPVLAAVLVAHWRNLLAIVAMVVLAAPALVIKLARLSDDYQQVPYLLGAMVGGAVAVMLMTGRATRFDGRPEWLHAVLAKASDHLGVVTEAVRRPVVLGGISVALVALINALPNPFALADGEAFFIGLIDRMNGAIVLADNVDLNKIPIRKPVLMEPQLIDYVAYVPAAAPALAQVMADVYGIDYFKPPVATRRKAAIDDEISRELWEQRTTEEWTALAEKYDLGGMIVRGSWKIALPRAALLGSPVTGIAVYRIPREKQ
ncbi:MAG: hypothetical protein H7840_00085 [Alphaproteobacteria bacterium]